VAKKKMVSFRFTAEVVDLLKRKASEQGITVTEYMKRIIVAEVFK
jgi:predicted DNA binding CopG/RHH family protein